MSPNQEPTQFNARFDQIVAQIQEVEDNMFAFNIYSGLESLGYKPELITHEDSFLCIRIPAADNYYVEIMSVEDGCGIEQPLMIYTEFNEMRRAATGLLGEYRYQADFLVQFDDSPADGEELEIRDEEWLGKALIGTVRHTAYSFHEFIQGAFYKIKGFYGVEIYPEISESQFKFF
jgi:hypothetical protein